MSLPEPYFDDGNGRVIYHGDCRDILPHLPKVDLVLTDPPYGIAHPTDYNSRRRGGITECRNDYPPIYGDDKPFNPQQLLDFPAKGRVLWGANWYADRLPVSGGWLVWDKLRPDDLDQATCELAWTDCIKGVRRYTHLWNGCMRQKEEGDHELYHPTQKPVALMRWAMLTRWTKDFQTVLDPYMGSGPVLRAAKDLGRKAIGIEISEAYCEIAANRLRQEVLAL